MTYVIKFSSILGIIDMRIIYIMLNYGVIYG